MVHILPVASGKGGVGKSSLSVNLAILLANRGKKTVLADFDFGGANLHTFLGLRNNHIGLGNFIYQQTNSLQDLFQETGIKNLYFIAGDGLFPGTANMEFFVKRKIFRELQSLDADYVLLDLGSGSTYNTLDFYLLSYIPILVTTPEITAVLNAYSFLKAAAYRFFFCQFKPKSNERIMIKEYIKSSTAGSENSLTDLIKTIAAAFPDSSQSAEKELKKYRPQVIMNMGGSTRDLDMARRLRALAQKKLAVELEFIGFIPRDNALPLSIARRIPIAVSDPDTPFVRQLDSAAARLLLHTEEYTNSMFENSGFTINDDTEDLNILTQEFNTQKNDTADR